MLSNIVDTGELWAFNNDLRRRLDEYAYTLSRDDSEYVYVDGEEGDHGNVKYSNAEGQLIFSHIIYGGDSDEIVLTAEGKKEFKRMFLESVEMAFSEIGCFA